MVLFFIKLLGRVSAASPVWLMRALCVVLGRVIGLCAGARRHVTLNNLHHAFPEQSEQYRRRVYYEACARVVEMALFMPASMRCWRLMMHCVPSSNAIFQVISNPSRS
jgi:lauroyl/myristoyl acyltransferase